MEYNRMDLNQLCLADNFREIISYGISPLEPKEEIYIIVLHENY